MTTDLVKARESYEAALKPMAAGPAWLQAARQKAFERFTALGFPTPKNERWKYTDLSLYLSPEIEKGSTGPVKPAVLAQLKSQGYDIDKNHWLVFLDGRYSSEQSRLKTLDSGIQLGNLAPQIGEPAVQKALGQTASYETDAFTALNLAAFEDGLFLSLAEGRILNETVHVVFVSTQSRPSWVRNLVLAGPNSRATVVEHFLEESTGSSMASSVTEIDLAPGAEIAHVKIQAESKKNLHLGRVAARQASGSRFNSRIFSFGGKLVRNETETLLEDRRAEASLDGLFMARDGQHVDNQTFIDHHSAQCSCQENYRGVLDGKATGVFDGRVLVRENAQKTDARQSNKNLLLSKTAKIYSKPQLQIYADDVKCSHGSATGQLDEQALFYLRARGIGKSEARRLLVEAFAGELVSHVEVESLRKPLEKAFRQWLEKSAEAGHES